MILLVLAACGPVAVPPAPERPVTSSPDTCGQTRVADLIRQPAVLLERREILDAVRVVRPGMAVTMDYLQQRLNIEVDEAGSITRTYCG